MLRLSFFRVHLFSILIVINGIVISTAQSCDPGSMQRCVEKLKPLMENADLSFAETDEELNAACRHFRDSMDCIDSFTRKCLPDSQRQQVMSALGGVQSFLGDICTQGSTLRAGMLKHNSCFRDTKSDQEHCAEKFTAQQEMLQKEDIQMSEKAKRTCCLFTSLSRCMESTTSYKCGQEAAAVMKQITEKLFGPMVKNLCPNMELDNTECPSAASLISIPGFLFLGIMVIAVLKH